MSENLNIKTALQRLELESVDELTVGHVEELVRKSPKVQMHPLAEFEFWEAFHVIREFTNRRFEEVLVEARRRNQEKQKSKIVELKPKPQQEINSPNIPRERREVRRDLGNLIYEIRLLKDLQPQLVSATKVVEETAKELQEAIEIQNKNYEKFQSLTEEIINLEKQFAATNNEKELVNLPQVKIKRQDELRQEIRNIKEKRKVIQTQESGKLMEYQKRYLFDERVLKDIQVKTAFLREKLDEYQNRVKLFSFVSLTENDTVRSLFLGPFEYARNAEDFEYVSLASEFGRTLMGKRQGEEFSFGDSTLVVCDIRLPDPGWLEFLMHPDHWDGPFILDLPKARSRIELWSRSPGFGNNSRHIWG